MRRPTVLGVAMAVGAVYLGRVLVPGAPLYASVRSDFALRVACSAIEILTLTFGAVYAARAAKHLGDGNPARPPWTLFATWLACFGMGQVTLSTYQIVLRVPAPLPSFGDACFFAGYAAMIGGLLLFRRTFARSGLAVGSPRPGATLGVAAVLVASVGAALAPVVAQPQPLAHRIVNALYPALDVAALVALFVLSETLRPLRGGRVFVVWSSLLASILLACVGDVLFAYGYFHGFGRFESLVNLVYMASYAAGAHGAWAQCGLVAGRRGGRARG